MEKSTIFLSRKSRQTRDEAGGKTTERVLTAKNIPRPSQMLSSVGMQCYVSSVRCLEGISCPKLILVPFGARVPYRLDKSGRLKSVMNLRDLRLGFIWRRVFLLGAKSHNTYNFFKSRVALDFWEKITSLAPSEAFPMLIEFSLYG